MRRPATAAALGAAAVVVFLAALAAACGPGETTARAQDGPRRGTPSPAPPLEKPPEKPPEKPTPSAPALRWIVGDLHVHVSPPDAVGHSSYDVAKLVAKAREQGLDFVVLAPHDADRSFPSGGKDPVSGQDLAASQAASALAAPPAPGPDGRPGPAPRPILVVSGWEYTRAFPGHQTLAFFRMSDVASLDGDEKPRRVIRDGGLAVVNHPFFRPVKMAPPFDGILASAKIDWSGDWRWKPFFGEGTDPLAWNAIEVWHERSVLVEKMHASRVAEFPDTQMARDAIAAWDRATREQKRRIVGVGGSDCHGRLPYAVVPMGLVSVGVEAFTEDALRRGLVGGRVTFGRDGGAAARTFAATSDVAGASARIGDSLAARAEVRLTWTGRAELFEDGASVGTFDGGATRRVEPPGSFRAWRIRCDGDQFSNPIYANLPVR